MKPETSGAPASFEALQAHFRREVLPIAGAAIFELRYACRNLVASDVEATRLLDLNFRTKARLMALGSCYAAELAPELVEPMVRLSVCWGALFTLIDTTIDEGGIVERAECERLAAWLLAALSPPRAETASSTPIERALALFCSRIYAVLRPLDSFQQLVVALCPLLERHARLIVYQHVEAPEREALLTQWGCSDYLSLCVDGSPGPIFAFLREALRPGALDPGAIDTIERLYFPEFGLLHVWVDDLADYLDDADTKELNLARLATAAGRSPEAELLALLDGYLHRLEGLTASDQVAFPLRLMIEEYSKQTPRAADGPPGFIEETFDKAVARVRSSPVAPRPPAGPHVLILGGGIGGLSAAHECSERGFRVTVCEKNGILGGKARSISVPDSATSGRKALPGEHGFRFFPGFYRHIDDLLKRIPFPGNDRGVFDNLVSAEHWYVARKTGSPLIAPAKAFASWRAAWQVAGLASRAFRGDALDVPLRDLVWFARRCLVLLTSSQGRRVEEYENVAWFDFFGGDARAEAFDRYILSVLPLIFVACGAKEMSARTGGMAFLRLCHAALAKGQSSDRVLNGPTNDVWIDPWAAHLRERGVEIETGARLLRFECDGKRITAAVLERDGRETRVCADYYVAALPAEVMGSVLTPDVILGAPSLAGIRKLRTEWMVGLQFYLDRPVPVARGHALFLDSPWMITTISQAQFWRDPIGDYGDGRVREVLSVIISDWKQNGILFDKPAAQCTAAELQVECWAQIKQHLRGPTLRTFEEARILASFVDPALTDLSEEGRRMHEPYLVNTLGSWNDRPKAVTELPNLFLAADYVQTHTDLATMEGANEAARRAVNGILDASDSEAARCPLWAPREPRLLAPLRWLDAIRYERRLPHVFDRRSRSDVAGGNQVATRAGAPE